MNFPQENIELIERFRAKLEQYCNDRRLPSPYAREPIKVEAMLGKKYARIVRNDGQRMCHCFIDLATCDILKAASWASPAKTPRGNLHDENMGIGVAVTEYGARYL